MCILGTIACGHRGHCLFYVLNPCLYVSIFLAGKLTRGKRRRGWRKLSVEKTHNGSKEGFVFVPLLKSIRAPILKQHNNNEQHNNYT